MCVWTVCFRCAYMPVISRSKRTFRPIGLQRLCSRVFQRVDGRINRQAGIIFILFRRMYDVLWCAGVLPVGLITDEWYLYVLQPATPIYSTPASNDMGVNLMFVNVIIRFCSRRMCIIKSLLVRQSWKVSDLKHIYCSLFVKSVT